MPARTLLKDDAWKRISVEIRDASIRADTAWPQTMLDQGLSLPHSQGRTRHPQRDWGVALRVSGTGL